MFSLCGNKPSKAFQMYKYKNVRRWTKNMNIFEIDRIFIPINVNNMHWLSIIAFMKLKLLHFIDSLNYNHNTWIASTLRWLKQKRIKQVDFNESEWKIVIVDSPKQSDKGNDCGLFVITCADYTSDDLPLTYSKFEMEQIRIKVGTDILRGYLNYEI